MSESGVARGTVGTWDWAQRTNGQLGRGDRLELIRQGALARLAGLPMPWQRAVGLDHGELRLIDPPDSALARAGEELVLELSAPVLYAHCLRTWMFAALLARRDRVDHDEELLYLACVLHDLGLTDTHDRRDPTAACFGVEGARAAHEFMCGHGQPVDRARTVAEAISLHLNITVPARLGPEAQLLSKGVALDVVGRNARRLSPEVIRTVGERWPREGLADYLNAATRRQAEIRPRSRSALLHRLGFAALVSANPLERGGSPGR